MIMVTITITLKQKDVLQGAIADGWNERFPDDELGPDDIKLQHCGNNIEGPFKEDILCALPFIAIEDLEVSINYPKQ